MQSLAQKEPQVIIVGAGFGGLEAAKKLACKDVHLTVIDRTNYHLFQPLLYQVATAALSPADIAAPVRAILSKCKNVEVILAEVESVDGEARKVKTSDRVFDYETRAGIEKSRRCG
jgi:NADH dehydrogenase